MPQVIEIKGRINELYPKVNLIKKYPIQTPRIPMGLSISILEEIPGSSFGL